MSNHKFIISFINDFTIVKRCSTLYFCPVPVDMEKLNLSSLNKRIIPFLNAPAFFNNRLCSSSLNQAMLTLKVSYTDLDIGFLLSENTVSFRNVSS